MAVLAFGFFFFIQLALQGCSNHQIFLDKITTTKIVGKMEMEGDFATFSSRQIVSK